MGVDPNSPYDVIGSNRNMSTDNIKKKYWKLSLLVHLDKCPHPQAHQAFIKLNKAFKELQDPDKEKEAALHGLECTVYAGCGTCHDRLEFQSWKFFLSTAAITFLWVFFFSFIT